MLAAFLSIIDRLIQLKEYRIKRRQSVYQYLLEPIFNDLLIVHRDYIQMFEKVHWLLLEGTFMRNIPDNEYIKKVREAVEYLRERRIEFEPLRVKLRSTVKELHGVKPVMGHRNLDLNLEADRFVQAVLYYFHSPDRELESGFSTDSEMLLEQLVDLGSELPNRIREQSYVDYALEDAHSPKLAYFRLKESLEGKIQRLRINWSLVCEAYVQLTVSIVPEV